jgi:hypothetical protein
METEQQTKRYKVTVTSIVEADSEEEATEHLWDGTTEVDVEEVEPEPEPVDPEVVKAVIARYDEIVRGNYSPTWNTIFAAFTDTTGDVIYEVLETAIDMGYLPPYPEENAPLEAALAEALSAYKENVLRDDPLNIPGMAAGKPFAIQTWIYVRGNNEDHAKKNVGALLDRLHINHDFYDCRVIGLDDEDGEVV